MPQIPFLGSSARGRSSNIDAGRRVNVYPEMDKDGKNVTALIGCPGTRLLVTLPGAGGIRGTYVPSSGNAIVVQGSSVYRVSTEWSYALAGSIDALSTPVSIADNGTVAVIVTGPHGYVLDLSSNMLTQITSDAFYGADVVQYLDGYFVFNKPGTQQFYISGLLASDFDALDFASAEGAPDKLVSLIVDHRELWLFGDTTTEVFSNTGNVDFPFERVGNAFIQQGCAAKFSPVAMDNSIFWIGKDRGGDRVVWRANGYTPARVSDHKIEHAMQGYADVSDASGFTYQQDGHIFAVWSFPSAGATWAYDCATGEWHERAYLAPSTGNLTRHRANCHMFFGGKHVVGDWENGNLYALDLDYYSDNGDPLPAIAVSQHIADPNYGWVQHRCLQVDMETGVGLEDESTPIAMLEWSDDGGHTWSSQRESPIGAIGQYRARVRWNRLGRSRDRVYRLTITDPVKRVIIGAALNPGA